MRERAPEVVLIGGGGHARVLLDALHAAGETRALGVLDADRALHGTRLLGVPVLGDDALLAELAGAGTRWFAVAFGGVRDNAPRRRAYDAAVALGLEPLTIVHPRATASSFARLGPGVQLLPGAIVNAGAELGCNVIVNSGAIVEHDCRVGDHVHLATGARLAGGVVVGAGAHVGAGAVVRELVIIGEGAVAGAGAVVIRDVRPSAVVAGVPAKELH